MGCQKAFLLGRTTLASTSSCWCPPPEISTRLNETIELSCTQHGIRTSGPPLGRPKQVSREEKKQVAADEAIRNRVEGRFGQGKRRFGLARVMAKLACTSAAQISLTFLVMNLERALQRLFLALLWLNAPQLTAANLSRQHPIRSDVDSRLPERGIRCYCRLFLVNQ